MLRISALGLLLSLALVVTGSSAPKPTPKIECGWRWEYENTIVPLIALADFDAVATKLGVTLDRLEAEGKLDTSGKHEIIGLFESLEEQYMEKWFGEKGIFTSSRSISSQSINNNYDREFRNLTRSKGPFDRHEAKLQDHNVVLTSEETGQDHDIVWTVEMAAKSRELAELATQRNGVIVKLIELINEQAGTSAVPAGRHSMKLAINPGTRNGIAVWWYSVEVRGQSNKWTHNGVFTEEMTSKLEAMKQADGERDFLNAELVQLYDEAGIAHYNPLDVVFGGQYHANHDCIEYGCDKWGEGQRFPPHSMIEGFDYPETPVMNPPAKH